MIRIYCEEADSFSTTNATISIFYPMELNSRFEQYFILIKSVLFMRVEQYYQTLYKKLLALPLPKIHLQSKKKTFTPPVPSSQPQHKMIIRCIYMQMKEAKE